MDVEMQLSRIIISEAAEQQIIVLKEKHGTRSFPIVIGVSEALAIDRRAKGLKTPRPLTHELLASVLEHLNAKLERIIINDLREHTFYAKLLIRHNGELIEVDSRPSDAIALGIAEDVPIFVAQHVLEEVCEDE